MNHCVFSLFIIDLSRISTLMPLLPPLPVSTSSLLWLLGGLLDDLQLPLPAPHAPHNWCQSDLSKTQIWSPNCINFFKDSLFLSPEKTQMHEHTNLGPGYLSGLGHIARLSTLPKVVLLPPASFRSLTLTHYRNTSNPLNVLNPLAFYVLAWTVPSTWNALPVIFFPLSFPQASTQASTSPGSCVNPSMPGSISSPLAFCSPLPWYLNTLQSVLPRLWVSRAQRLCSS